MMKLILLRALASAFSDVPPNMLSEPLVGRTSPPSIFIIVVLPAPLGPISPQIIPFLMLNDTLSAAFCFMYCFVRSFASIITLSISYLLTVFS